MNTPKRTNKPTTSPQPNAGVVLQSWELRLFCDVR